MSIPEGPKAQFTAEEASEAYISHPPSAEDLDKISNAQKLITDEWTGEPPPHEQKAAERVDEESHPKSTAGK
jgi:hypothetical protein